MNLSYAQQMGDVNNSGSVDIVDALRVAQYYVGLSVSINTDVADVNCSGTIDIVDALRIAQYYVGLVSSFPCSTPVVTVEPTIAPTPTPLPGEGTFSFSPPSITTTIGSNFTTTIILNSGNKKVSYYIMDIYYDSTAIDLNTAIGTNGVVAGTNGFVGSVNVQPAGVGIGSINMTGTSTTGTGSGSALVFLTINWIARTESTSIIDLYKTVLIDINSNAIGTPDFTDTLMTVTVNAPATPEPTAEPTLDPTVNPTKIPGEGDVNFSISKSLIYAGDNFSTTVSVNAGDKQIVFMDFIVNFVNGSITPDVALGNNGVLPAGNVILTNVSQTSQSIEIQASADGALQGSEVPLFTINWTAVAESFSTLEVIPYTLTDQNGYIIGNLIPVGSMITIWRNETPEPTAESTIEPTLEVTAEPTAEPTAGPTAIPMPTLVPLPAEAVAVRCGITFQNDVNGIADRWIPNITRMSKPFTVTIKGEKSTEYQYVDLPADLMSVKISNIVDANWQLAPDADGSNLRKNAGNADIVLCATNQAGTVEAELATFTLNAFATSRDNSYTMVYNDAYFDPVTGRARADRNIALVKNNAGQIVFTDNGNVYNYFSLKAVESNNRIIRPGDDFLLRFALCDYTTPSNPAAPGDFLAVYDFKMMWRANLYVNEGANDWNNLHPWTAAQGNGWDITGNGNQSQILPHTSIFNVQVTDAVSYSFGCADTPMTFNIDLQEQQGCIDAKYSGNNNEWIIIINPNPHPAWSPWNTTLAPEGLWANYLKGIPQNDAKHNYAPIIINDEPYYPYTPGFSSRMFLDGIYNYGTHVCYSAGVECQGLLMRSASYLGNRYDNRTQIPENKRMLFNEYVSENIPGMANMLSLSWEITTKENIENSNLLVT